jgi:hypothetical protein
VTPSDGGEWDDGAGMREVLPPSGMAARGSEASCCSPPPSETAMTRRLALLSSLERRRESDELQSPDGSVSVQTR